MSLILTSQKSSEPNSRPYDYQNYFSSTMKIAKGSKIALNHVTINRNAFFNFTEEKVFFIYHGVTMPDSELKMRDMPDSTGAKNALLEDTTSVLTPQKIKNYVNYPQPVIVEQGEYSVKQLCDKIKYRLNNPSASYGGDFFRTGFWNVIPVYNSSNEFQYIEFDWDTSTNTIAAAFPPDNSFIKLYPDNNNITYSKTSERITGGDANWNCGEFDRFINNHNGTIRFNIQSNNIIAGLTRVTVGERHQEFFPEYHYKSAGASILDCPRGLDFFDYCVASDTSGKMRVFILKATIDPDENAPVYGNLEMEEYDYGTLVDTDTDSYAEFKVKNNNVEIVLFSKGKVGATINKQLKPIGNTTYQLVPKVSIKGTSDLDIGAAPLLLSDTNKPIYPSTINVGGETDYSDCNIWHICHGIWWSGNILSNTITNIDNTFLYRMFDSIMGTSTIKSDDDAMDVQDGGQSISISDMDGPLFNDIFWTYEFDESLNANAGGFKYQYKLPVSGKEYLFDGDGTVIIPYRIKNTLFHVVGTLDGAIGINPKYKKGVEAEVDGNQIVQILGNNRIALNNNDILYVRIDLGNGYTMNGATSSVSKIISPILTDTASVDIGTSLGIRTYTPERMYLDLNNSEDIYINSINVSIVTKGERFAVELAPSTSASFHIIPPN